MYIILYFLTFLAPIVAVPFCFLMLLIDEKNRKHYMIQLSISLAFFAYCWKPSEIFDLFVWHKSCAIFESYSLSQMFEVALNKGEIINLMLKYFVGLTHNYNLLEFIVVLTTLLLLNKYIYDISKEKGLSKKQFALIYFFMGAILLFVNFISGLFFNFGLIFVMIGIRLIYNNKKIVGFICLAISFCIHSGMLYPIILFLFFYFNKSKLNIKTLVFFMIGAFSITTLIPIFLSKVSGISIFSEINVMYKAYFLDEKQSATNKGYFQIINFIQSIPLLYIMIVGNKKIDKVSSFAIILWMSSVIIDFKSPIFVRYLYPANVLFLPSFGEYIKNRENENVVNKKIFYFIMISVIGISLFYQCNLLSSINAIDIIRDNFYKSIFYVF